MTHIFTLRSATGSVVQFMLCQLHGDLIHGAYYEQHLRDEGRDDLADEWQEEMA